MDNTREKLIELEREATDHASDICIYHHDCEDCPGRKYGTHCRDYLKVDYIISHGVTIATDNNVGDKLTPTGCEYCQEDAEGYRRMIGAFSITNPFHGRTWQIETAHCKPREIFFCPMCGRKFPKKG